MCNGFGLWDLYANEIAGYGIFPTASLFNHSCVPNLFHQQLAWCGKWRIGCYANVQRMFSECSANVQRMFSECSAN
eukprot:781558-Prorocentrum_minimum.AAC.1